jgi:hypothetical protein
LIWFVLFLIILLVGWSPDGDHSGSSVVGPDIPANPLVHVWFPFALPAGAPLLVLALMSTLVLFAHIPKSTSFTVLLSWLSLSLSVAMRNAEVSPSIVPHMCLVLSLALHGSE